MSFINFIKENEMTLILFGLTILSVADCLRILVSAKSAIHEIEALMMLLIAAICFSACGIVRAIEQLKNYKQGIIDLTDVIK